MYTEIQGAIILEVNLKQRVCELYPSQHQDVKDNTVRIEFELEWEDEIATAVGKTFSFSEVSSPNDTRPLSYKTCQLSMKFQLLIKSTILKIKTFLPFKLSDDVFIMLINVEVPTIVGILTFMRMVSFMLS